MTLEVVIETFIIKKGKLIDNERPEQPGINGYQKTVNLHS